MKRATRITAIILIIVSMLCQLGFAANAAVYEMSGKAQQVVSQVNAERAARRFARVTGIDFPSEGAGLVPDVNDLKQWSDSTIGNIPIGQGISVTPLRLDVTAGQEVRGTEGDDLLLGTMCGDEIVGLGGQDNIDGRGGADPSGSGLSGLASRVAAADGVFTVDSPVGGPTVVRAWLPVLVPAPA